MGLYEEIFEQAQTAQRILEEQRENIETIAANIRERQPDTVFLAARGTSDNAGRYINYLWGAYNRLPVTLATPSLFSIYQRPPRLHNTLVIGISQSGKSPDIVSVLAEARNQGCPTLTITNAPGSPLSQLADWEIDICAGVETAVAATKTYSASMMAAAMLSCALAQDEARWEQLSHVPGWITEVLRRDETIARIAERYRFMEQCVVLGRGFNYATAFEWSLKMKELCYVMADPYSSADFQHGPIALVEQGFPVMAVAPKGEVLADLMGLMELLCEERKVELLTLSNDDDVLSLGQSAIQLPADMPEWISPIVSIVPAQLFAYYLTVAKGFDTEAPRGLKKVTETV
ncbi:MAG: SIS domain-containing protein [Anaerolineae bacterium]|jgi:glucosamine--fructose-6-phosphate aminotransferase (isomerizing)|nr:SIS domain-containing protein [Anaerolineae bacterium]